jgi:urease accessory protein
VAAAFAAAAVETANGRGAPWSVLDAELDARTPAAAQREASRAQGRAALRAARVAWPSPVLDALVAASPRPHHPLLVGAVIGIDGGSQAEAAQCAAYLAVSGPASAAVRLLGLDPFAVNAAVVALRPALDAVVAAATAAGPPDRLPAPGAPVLDLMAQAHVRHHREQVRLFVS